MGPPLVLEVEGAADRPIAFLVLRRPAQVQHPLVLADVPADLAAAACLGDQPLGRGRFAFATAQCRVRCVTVVSSCDLLG